MIAGQALAKIDEQLAQKKLELAEAIKHGAMRGVRSIEGGGGGGSSTVGGGDSGYSGTRPRSTIHHHRLYQRDLPVSGRTAAPNGKS